MSVDASTRGYVIAVDEHGNLGIETDDSGRITVDLASSLTRDAATSSCVEPATGRSKRVPVYVPFDRLAPLVDPALWSEYTPIRISDVVRTGSCADGKHGWSGTLVETYSPDVFGITTVVTNRLAMRFCYDGESSRASFSLDECLRGGITYDSGFVAAEPTLLGFGELRAEKTLNWAPGSAPCRLPRLVNEAILGTALTLGLIEYALRVFANVHAEVDDALRSEFGLLLEELGFDSVRGRVLPHFFDRL